MSDRSYPNGLLLGLLLLVGIAGVGVVATGSVAAQQTDVDVSDLEGDGTQTDPYTITNASELQAIEDDLDAQYELSSDINASNTSQWNNNKGFDPIGDSPENSTSPPAFTGSLDGNSHTLTGLTIDREGEGFVGLVGYADASAELRDISLKNITVNGGYSRVGGLVGENAGSALIQNVTVTGKITGTYAVGGLIGINRGPLQNVTVTTNVTGSYVVGGLVGTNSAPIQNATAKANAIGSSYDVGGLVGYNYQGPIQNTMATGTVDGSNDVGGLVGENRDASVRNSTAAGNINGSNNIGGLVGFNVGSGSVQNVTATSTVDSIGSAGGLVGKNRDASIQNATAIGTVDGGDEVGGLVGKNIGTGEIRNGTATGDVTGSRSVGGFVGINRASVYDSLSVGSVYGDHPGGFVGTSFGSIQDSYWDKETAGATYSAGTNETGLTTAEMTGQAAEKNMTGLSFGTVWQTQPNGYPFLTSIDAISPTADAGSNQTVSYENTAAFDATYSNGYIGLASYEWSFGDGKTATGATPSYTYKNPGNYTATLTVTDYAGNTDTDTTVTAVKDTTDPTADAGSNRTVNNGTAVTFDATASSDNVRIISYEWEFGDGETATGATPSHTYTEPGTYTATVMLSDDSDNTDSASVRINVTAEGYVNIHPIELSGSGSSNNPYIITNISELQAMEDDLDAHYELGNDIDASTTAQWNTGSGFDPVGTNSYNNSLEFTGSLVGNGHTITALTINRSDEDVVGIIGSIDSNTTIRDIEIKNINVSGSRSVGGLAGWNDGSIQNVTISGNITGSDQIGGLAGSNYGSIQNVTATGTVTITGPIDYSYSSGNVGGLVGDNDNEGSIQNATATSTVTGSGNVGGLVGDNSGGSIQNATATGTVTGYSYNVGGLVGHNHESGSIRSATAKGNVTGSANNAGGLVGANGNDGSIQNATATGNVTGSDQIGGLVGSNSGSINYTLSKGSVTGATGVGGLVGENDGGKIKTVAAYGDVSGDDRVGGLVGSEVSDYLGSIQNAFAVGSIEEATNVGGLIGGNPFRQTQQHTYWDKQATGQSTSLGTGTGLTTAQMTGQAAETNMTGLAFGTVWETHPDEYPVLVSQVDKNDSDRIDPTPDAGSDQTVSNGTAVAFDATASSDNVEIVSYEWIFGDGTTATGATPTHTYDSPGNYTATVTITDAAGNTATDTTTTSVKDTTAPVADAGSNQTVDNGTAVAFDATASNDNVRIVSYEWAFSDGSTATGATPSHTYSSPGNYTATLTVTDDAGNADTDTITVTVEDPSPSPPEPSPSPPEPSPSPPEPSPSPPEPSPSPPDNTYTVDAGSNQTVYNGTAAEFNATTMFTTTDLSYSWMFGDGSNATSLNPSHIYSSPGQYTATLTVTDDAGNTATDSVTITVVPDQNSTQVEITNTSLAPSTVDSGSTSDHTLTFEAQNVSSDNVPDNVTVEMPQSVGIVDVKDVTVLNGDYDVTYSNNESMIEFTVDPERDVENVDLEFEVDMMMTGNG